MKKILLMAAIGAMTFVSCNKDDDNSSDCFDCTVQGITTEYCHEDGKSYYTVSFAGTSTDVELGETSWEDYKAAQSENEYCN